MKILITFAMDAEFAPWRKRREFALGESRAVPLYRTEIGAAEVFVGITGMGPGIGPYKLGALFAMEPQICVSSGLAGALKPDYTQGEILAAGAVTSLHNRDALTSDVRLLRSAVACGARKVESLVTADRVIATPAEKQALGSFADAVEMESYLVLGFAARRGIQTLAVRAISDACDEELPGALQHIVRPDGSVRVARVLTLLLAQPSAVSKLIGLGRRSRQAAETLCGFLDEFVATLAPEVAPEEAAFAAKMG